MRAISLISVAVLTAGCAAGDGHSPRTREVGLGEVCVIAGNQCVKNIGDVAGCRASQKTCLATAAQVVAAPRPKSGSHPAAIDLANIAPPLDPGGEQPDNQTDPATVAWCVSHARDLVETRLRGHIDRTLITYSQRWGVVWRADFTVGGGGEASAQRYVCSRSAFVTAPLKMFDPSQNTAPLP